MKKLYFLFLILNSSFLIFNSERIFAQCDFIPSTSSSIDTLYYSFSGGIFASYGCAPIDPSFWLSGNGIYVTINFVNPQDYPAVRVWGMNDDDSASVDVNGLNYPMNLASASYAPKVVCGISPGPDGVIFANGKIVGANSNGLGNYSYSDVTINSTGVTTITVTGTNGAGWGFAGTVVECAPLPVAAFSANPNSVCPGTCLAFTNLSINATTYEWTFAGANPSTGTDINPTSICYNTPGSYDVSLIVTNAAGSDTLTLNNYITVYPFPPPQGITQSGDTLFANQGAMGYQWYHTGVLIPGATDYFFLASQDGDYNVVATDANGCEVEAAIFDVVASVLFTVSDLPFTVYPNPVENRLAIGNVQFAINAISIYNLFGEMLMAVSLPTSNYQLHTELNVHKLASGLYWLEVSTVDKIYRTKFVKQ